MIQGGGKGVGFDAVGQRRVYEKQNFSVICQIPRFAAEDAVQYHLKSINKDGIKLHKVRDTKQCIDRDLEFRLFPLKVRFEELTNQNTLDRILHSIAPK